MQGYVQIEKDVVIETHRFDFILISRRSCERSGLRYQRRGVDAQGHVANFVETEQLICFRQSPMQIASFVQIRGSVPLFWSQSPLRRKPIPQMERNLDENVSNTPNASLINLNMSQLEAIQRHFSQLKSLYGDCVSALSLVETGGRESVLGQEYCRYMKQLPENKYHSFDLHLECKGMRYENLGRLLEQLSGEMSEIGYFWCSQADVFQTQQGVLRTNVRLYSVIIYLYYVIYSAWTAWIEQMWYSVIWVGRSCASS